MKKGLILPIFLLTACGGSETESEPEPIKSHEISTKSLGNGNISPASKIVKSGESGTFSITPNEGYSIEKVTGCNGELTGDSYTTGVVTASCQVKASFSLNSYTVTANALEGGSVTPKLQTIDYADRALITVTPDKGYSIDSIVGCDGELEEASYRTAPVTSECEVTASFAIDTVELIGDLSWFYQRTSNIGNPSITIDGLAEEIYEVTYGNAGSFSIQIKANDELLNSKTRMRIRATGKSHSGEPLQITSSIQSFSSLYKATTSSYSVEDIVELNISPLTTAIDAYVTSLASSSNFETSTYNKVITSEATTVAIEDRLAIIELIDNDNNIGMPSNHENLHSLLSSYVALNTIKSSFYNEVQAAKRRVINSLKTSYPEGSLPLKGEYYSLSWASGVALTGNYLNLKDELASYGSNNLGWLLPETPYKWEEGRVTFDSQVDENIQNDEYCDILIADLELPEEIKESNYSTQMLCQKGIHNIQPLIALGQKHLVSIVDYTYLPAQQVYIDNKTIQLTSQTVLNSSLVLLEKLPDNWSFANKQIDIKGGETWVLPSMAPNSFYSTDSFLIGSDHTYRQTVIYSELLEGFDSFLAQNPDEFSESGVWALENGSTLLKLYFPDGHYASIEKVEDTSDEPNPSLIPVYLVKYFSPDGLILSKRLQALMSISNPLSSVELLNLTAGNFVLQNDPMGNAYTYPKEGGSFFAWKYTQDEVQSLSGYCDGSYMSWGERCDGLWSLEQDRMYSMVQKPAYLLFNSLPETHNIPRVHQALDIVGDYVIMFEHGIWRTEYNWGWDTEVVFHSRINGRIIIKKKIALN